MALALFAGLAIAHTWPLASAPATLGRTDNADAALNIWALSWVGTHLIEDPRRIFDANIFHPERLTLAYSEPMLLQGALAAPLVALGVPPLLTFNVILLAGFTLTGWAFCLLVWRWTGSWTAGCVAGSLAAFNAHVLVRMGHLQTMHPEFFAVLLFALDRAIASPRTRHAAWLAGGFVLQALTSIYLMVFAVWMLLFAFFARAGEWLRHRPAAVVGHLALAATLALVLLWPYLSVFQELRAVSGLARAVDDQVAGRWWDYLATGARLHAWWMPDEARASITYGFPGVTAIALVAFAASRRDVRHDPRFRMCVGAAVGCLIMAVAPRLPFYPVLHHAVPLFQAVRVPAHLSQVVLLLVAVLAGFGVAALGRRWPRAAGWPAAVALMVLVNLEASRVPMGYVPFAGVPPVMSALAGERRAVVVEVPFPMPSQWFLNGAAMLNSTAHWRPMLNGYSGFRPASYERSFQAARTFPSAESLIALHDLGVTHVVVHRQALGEARAALADTLHELQHVASDGEVSIFRFRTSP